VPLLTLNAIAGVAIGVAVLITVLSVMRGFNQELIRRLLGFDSHIIIETSAGDKTPIPSEEVDKLVAPFSPKLILPFVEGEVIIKANLNEDVMAQGVKVRGIDLEKFSEGKRIWFYSPKEEQNFSGAYIGKDISQNLLLHPDFQDSFELIAPLAKLSPTGELIPNKKKYAVAGLFRTGVYQYDNQYIFLPMKDAVSLLGEQVRRGYLIELGDINDALKVKKHLTEKLSGFEISTWQERNNKLFSALKLERYAMTAVLIMVILISSFSIMGIVLMMSASRQKDVALMQVLGFKKDLVRRIFLYQGLIIGVIGSSIGLCSAFVICTLLKRWPISLPSTYYLDYLPVDFSIQTSLMLGLVGVLIAFVSSYWPTQLVGKRAAAEVLRYE